MKITAIELGLLRVPLKTPFKTALRSVDHVEDIVVRIRTDDGATGWGGAPPSSSTPNRTSLTWPRTSALNGPR